VRLAKLSVFVCFDDMELLVWRTHWYVRKNVPFSAYVHMLIESYIYYEIVPAVIASKPNVLGSQAVAGNTNRSRE